MATALALQLNQFAQEVLTGLTAAPQKWLPPKYFYDDLGSALFEAITYLPEYGLTRADERLLQGHSSEITTLAGAPSLVIELGSGSGRKTRHLLQSLQRPVYRPIDISAAALSVCASQLQDVADVRPEAGEWVSRLERITAEKGRAPMLLLFLGSSIGNFSRSELKSFFGAVRACLRPGDTFLLGADLVKSVPVMLQAYDDATGVTAAFNLNVLARINRELAANFDLRSFQHQARWNQVHRAVQMHLVSSVDQTVHIGALDLEIPFKAGESIWTESSHKFTLDELDSYASKAGFAPVKSWIAEDWPFAEVLWRPS